MNGNQRMIRMHLERHLIDTDQKGNSSVWNLMGYCIGYYGAIDRDVMNVIMKLHKEGWVHD